MMDHTGSGHDHTTSNESRFIQIEWPKCLRRQYRSISEREDPHGFFVDSVVNAAFSRGCANPKDNCVCGENENRAGPNLKWSKATTRLEDW